MGVGIGYTSEKTKLKNVLLVNYSREALQYTLESANANQEK